MNLKQRLKQLRNPTPPPGWMTQSQLAKELGYSQWGSRAREVVKRLIEEKYLECKTYRYPAKCYREVKSA